MFNMFMWGKRKLAIDSDTPDEGTSSKKRRQDEEEVMISSKEESGKLYKRDNLCSRHQALDNLSDSDEYEDDRPLENDQGSHRPPQNSPSIENRPKYVSSGMNTVETGEIMLDQSSTSECRPRESTVSKESPCRHFCQFCGKSSRRIRSQISKMCLKSVTSQESRPLIRPSTADQSLSTSRNITRSRSSTRSRSLHCCQSCGKSPRRSIQMNRQASDMSLVSVMSQESSHRIRSSTTDQPRRTSWNRTRSESNESLRSLHSCRYCTGQRKSPKRRRSINLRKQATKMSLKSVRPRKSRIRPSTTDQSLSTSRNRTRSESNIQSCRSLHSCVYCTGRRKSSRRSIPNSTRASKRSLVSLSSRKSKSTVRPYTTDRSRSRSTLHSRTRSSSKSRYSNKVAAKKKSKMRLSTSESRQRRSSTNSKSTGCGCSKCKARSRKENNSSPREIFRRFFDYVTKQRETKEK